jgi:hypothetical protein
MFDSRVHPPLNIPLHLRRRHSSCSEANISTETEHDIPLNLSPMSRSASARAGGRVESRLLKSILTPRYLFNVECSLLSNLAAETGGEDIQKEGMREGKERKMACMSYDLFG